MQPDIKVFNADARDVLLTLEPNSIDGVVTDPPYVLESILKRFGKPGSAAAVEGNDGRFRRSSEKWIGQEWDTAETVHNPEFWAEILRVLKPGAYLASFAGTKTYHRMACAIEDGGFEVRDMAAWLYETGMPKSHDLDRLISDRAFAAWLEINTDQKLDYAGQLGIAGDDAAKVKTVRNAFKERAGPFLDAIKWEGWGTMLKPALEPACLAQKPLIGTIAENVAAHGVGGIDIDSNRVDSRWPANVLHDGVLGDRHFFNAKADAADRWGSKHPSVKPIDLKRFFIRLIIPPGGTVIDPFAGSGTTGVAAIAEHRSAILIERDAEFAADIEERLAHYRGDGRHSLAARVRHKAEKTGSLL